MKVKKILVVGFGKMGCRHAQSLINDPSFEVHILENSKENIINNLKLINYEYNDFFWYNNIVDIPILDMAIIATSSNPRFDIFNRLLDHGYRYFLLEKIVFQSKKQFDKAIELVESTNSSVYCNFVNRYFKAYQNIKNELLPNENIQISVHGGPFGLGCNSIHYLDLFQYLTNNSKIKYISSNITESKIKNRRGSHYKEFYGILNFKNSKGDTINIISDNDYNGSITIRIQQNDNFYFLNQGTQKVFSNSKLKSHISDFKIIPSSKLTNLIVNDILSEKTLLTNLIDTYDSHINLFKPFNNALNLSSVDNCPIT